MQWVLYIIIFACTLNYWPTDAKKSDTATTKRDHPLTTAHPVTKKSERTKERKNDDQKNQASAKQPNCQRSGKSASNGNRGNSTRSKRSVGEGKNHQELICKPGQAVSSIRFTTKDDGYQVFEIQCLNVTDSENVVRGISSTFLMLTMLETRELSNRDALCCGSLLLAKKEPEDGFFSKRQPFQFCISRAHPLFILYYVIACLLKDTEVIFRERGDHGYLGAQSAESAYRLRNVLVSLPLNSLRRGTAYDRKLVFRMT